MLHRCISDLGFLFDVLFLLKCVKWHLYNSYIQTARRALSYAPVLLPDFLGPQRMVSIPEWKDGPGPRSHRLLSQGNTCGCLSANTCGPGLYHSKVFWVLCGVDLGLPSSVYPLSCLQGCMVQSSASGKWILRLGQMLICTLIHLLCLLPLLANECTISTLIFKC